MIQDRRRVRSQAGMTLIETLIVVTIVGMVLVPVMAWAFTAMDRQANADIDADTAGFTQLNRFLSADVAQSVWGVMNADDSAPYNGCLTPLAGSDPLLVLQSEDRDDPTVVSYNKVSTGETDPGTGDPLNELVRRRCTPSSTVEESTVADKIVGDITVHCEERARYKNAIAEDGVVLDQCGEVAMTLQGNFGEGVTLRASRQVDPMPDPVPGSRPIPVIACSPACPATGYREFSVTFDGTLSSDRDPGGLFYSWDFGDGSSPSYRNDARATHTYTTIGNFTVTLTVSNSTGGTASITTQVTVRNAVPVALATPNPMTAFRNQAVQFDGSGSSDPDDGYGPGLSYLWNFGDGNTRTGEISPWHTYASSMTPQRVNASLTVNDNDPTPATGQSSTVQIPVDVRNSLPAVDLDSDPEPVDCVQGNPESGKCIRVNDFPLTVTLTAMNPSNGQPGAHDPDGFIPPSNYKWDIRRKGSVNPSVDPRFLGNARTLSYTFNQNGVYTVTLEVTDNDGGRTIQTIEVSVNKRPVVVATPEKCVINVQDPVAECEFDASGSTDDDGTITGYEWDWGDGTVETYSVGLGNLEDGVVRSHTYDPRPDFGTFNATLTVTDNDGSRVTADLPVKVNRPPVPKILPDDLDVYRLLEFMFNGTGSTDPDGDSANMTYAWEFGDGATGTGHTSEHTYTTLGARTVRVTVTDEDGGVATTTRVLVVKNQKPVANIYVPGRYLNDPGPYTFTASALPHSQDPDGTITNYRWDFGDGSPIVSGSNMATVDHTFPTYGYYDVTLTVTDNDGATSTDTIEMKVNRAPTASFTTNPNPPRALDPPFKVDFDASASNDPDGDNELLIYTWDFGDGTTGTGRTISHTYTTRGQFTVRLTVDDQEGGIDTMEVSALVGVNRLPVAMISTSPVGANNGQNVNPATWTFDPTGSNDPDGTIASFSWDFGDGSAPVTGAGGALAPVPHTYTTFGTFTVRLTLTDNEGSTASATVVVKVNRKPVAVIKPDTPNPLRAGRGVPFQFNALSSNDPDGTISSYLWDFGDGKPATGLNTSSTPAYTYTENGTYTVTLLVRDNNNPAYVSDTVSTQIIVDNSPPTARIVTTPGVSSPGKVVSNAAPFAVNFSGATSSDPDGSIVSYSWDFDDGSPVATGVTASHTFTDFGTYDVVLTVTDDSGLTDTETVQIRVNRRPTAVIDVVSGEPCAASPPCTITFSAANSNDADGSITGLVRWLVDGTQRGQGSWAAGETSFTWTFNQVGRSNVTLIVQDNDGQQGTVVYQVRINEPPVAGFVTNPDPAVLNTAPYTISFNGGSPHSSDPDGTVASYSWDFGDGNTATGATPSHTYATEGTYTVTLTVTDNRGITASVSKPVKVNMAPVAVIGPSTLDPKLNLPFQFDGTGSSDPDGSVASYAWDFGDGNNGTGATPTHTYTATGDYTVSLTVTDDNGRTHTTTRTLTVAPNQLPTATFVTDPESGRGDGAPAEIGFDASASSDPDGTIVSWEWDFGDGTTGSGETATHTYTGYGEYTATLTVTDNNGESSTTTRPILINQVPVPTIQTFPEPPVFNDEPYTLQLFAELSFDPDGTIVSYEWDFGDGSTGTGTPTSHTYDDYGTYTVTLTVTDDDGGTATDTVDVKVNRPPVAGASYSPSDVRRNAEVAFEATGSFDPDGEIVLYQWNFGDGWIETGRNAVHTYATMGDFEVTLTVVDDNGAQAQHSFTISVGNADPVATILTTPSPATVDLGTPITFWGDLSEDSDGTIVSYEWDLGDGTLVSGDQVVHTYDDYGTYPVTLVVTDNDGSTSSDMIFVKVNRPPTVTIGSTEGLTRGIPFNFTSTSGDADGEIVSWIWQFGDGGTASGPNPTYTYGSDGGIGPYTILLTVTDDDGRQTIAEKVVTLINQLPTAQASAQRVRNGVVGGAPTGPAPLEIEFSGLGSSDPDGTISTYKWNFGDGSPEVTSFSPTVRHTYTGSFTGTRVATLTVTDNNGGTAQKTVNVNVTANTAPTASFTFSQQSQFGGPVEFDASASSDPDGWIVGYTWDFDDLWNGADDAGTGVNPTKTLGTGYWTVRLTVTDNSGGTSSTTRNVYVQGSPNAPTVSHAGGGRITWNEIPGAVQYKWFAVSSGGGFFCPGTETQQGFVNVTNGHPGRSIQLSSSQFACDNNWTVKVQARNFGANEWSVESNSLPVSW